MPRSGLTGPDWISVVSMKHDLSPRLEALALAVIACMAAAIPLYHGIDRSFLANPDADFYHIGQTLDLLSAEPIEFYPHTGYVYFLLFGGFLEIGHALGFVYTTDWTTLTASPNFETAITSLVVWGRVLAILLAVIAVLVFWWVARLLTGNAVLSVCAAFAFASSIGLAVQASQLRTELLMFVFVLAAFLALPYAAKSSARARSGFIFTATFFAFLAAMTKIQAILIVLFLPALAVILAFGSSRSTVGPAPGPHNATAKITMCVALFFLSAPTFWQMGALVAAAGGGGYQAAILVYVLACILLACHLVGDRGIDTMVAISAAFFGVAAAHSLTFIEPHTWTMDSIVNFVAAGSSYSEGGGGSAAEMIGKAMSNILGFVSNHLMPGQVLSKAYPFAVIYWAAGIGCLVLIVTGDPRRALLPGALLAMAIILPATFLVRGYFTFYYLLAEPFAILALVTASAAFLAKTTRPIATYGGIVAVCLFVGAVQGRYILIAPSTATTRITVECDAPYAEKMAPQLMNYCRANLEPQDETVYFTKQAGR